MKKRTFKISKSIVCLLAFMIVFSVCKISFKADAAPMYNLRTVLEKSNLPVINIKIENGEAPDKVDKENKKNATFEIRHTNGKGTDLYILTDTETVDGEETVVWPMTIKGRGNSTWVANTDKKPYNIKFKENQAILGKCKSWSLLANWMDSTFVRNYLALKMGKMLNTSTVDCELVDLCINGKYEGVYLLTEKYGIGNTRIATAGDGKDINDDGEITQFLIEADSRSPGVEPNSFTSYSGIYFAVKEPDEEEIISEDDWRFSHAQYLINKADRAIMTGKDYEKYIDIDSFIDVYIIQELTKNPDFGFGYQPVYASTFLYAEEGGKIYSGTIWDFDISMGRTNYGDQSVEGSRDTLNPDSFLHKNTKWVKELFKDPEFEQKVKERWTEVSPMLSEMVNSLLPETTELIRPSARMDFATWGGSSIRKGGWEGRESLNFVEESEYVLNFLNERIAWLDSQWIIKQPEIEETTTPSYNWMLIISVSAAIILIAATIITFAIIKKKRKKREIYDITRSRRKI